MTDDRVSAEDFLLSAPLSSENALTCPKCGAPTEVKDSRPKAPYGFTTTGRRRLCVECGNRFNTIEVSTVVYERLINRVLY